MAALRRDDLLPQLWEEHQATRFPPHLRGGDIAGVDLVLVDAAVAGLVSRSFHGTLDERHSGYLQKSIADFEKILPLNGDEEGTSYYERLHRIAELTAQRGMPDATHRPSMGNLTAVTADAEDPFASM
jgi:hypothetical protein